MATIHISSARSTDAPAIIGFLANRNLLIVAAAEAAPATVERSRGEDWENIAITGPFEQIDGILATCFYSYGLSNLTCTGADEDEEARFYELNADGMYAVSIDYQWFDPIKGD